MTDQKPLFCGQCGEEIPEWYLKTSAGAWCQNCDE